MTAKPGTRTLPVPEQAGQLIALALVFETIPFPLQKPHL